MPIETASAVQQSTAQTTPRVGANERNFLTNIVGASEPSSRGADSKTISSLSLPSLGRAFIAIQGAWQNKNATPK
jgi:hypothetical protein